MIAELAAMGTVALGAALTLALLAGVVKGMTGFGLPMILVSGLGSFLSPELTLAGMILPALVTNLFQALRQGSRAALQSARMHWRYLATMLAFICLGSQFVRSIPAGLLFLILGATVTFFASLQLAGWRPRVSAQHRRPTEIGTGAVAGILSGLTGTWGPPTALYLTALGVPRTEHVRIQGAIYGAGAVTLTLAHLQSGVLSGLGLNLSIILVLPALAGAAAGVAVQDRLDQERFRTLILTVLVLAGLNLVRRAVWG
ncbi:MAG: sulfite exporter TauE/SafE family protein [Boseongicola sp. SB0670_bin_30]|nr:sulfite exporter TauE/SafE family protein [Boseongicola sp. SB0670_bin_30]